MSEREFRAALGNAGLGGQTIASIEASLDKAELIVVSRELLDSLVDEDDCWFDHHGGCQAHGYLSLDQGELCPHEEAKRLLRASSQCASAGATSTDESDRIGPKDPS